MMSLPLAKMPRDQLPPGDVLCNQCTAKCCRYFALPMEQPTEWKDFEFIRWYLMHTPASVFTEDGTWYLVVHNVCQHLQADHRCGVYETRPQICREYSTNDCEYEDDWVYEQYFETPDQVFEFAEALLGPLPAEVPPPDQKKAGKRGKLKRGKQTTGSVSFRTPAPPLLPVVG